MDDNEQNAEIQEQGSESAEPEESSRNDLLLAIFHAYKDIIEERNITSFLFALELVWNQAYIVGFMNQDTEKFAKILCAPNAQNPQIMHKECNKIATILPDYPAFICFECSKLVNLEDVTKYEFSN